MLSGREEHARYKALEVQSAYDTPLIFRHKYRRDVPIVSEVARHILHNQSMNFHVLATPILTLGRNCRLRKLNKLNLFVGVACRANLMTVLLFVL